MSGIPSLTRQFAAWKATVDRLSGLALDGLILYDIDDESSRNPVERPFPFSPTVDPASYRSDHLGSWQTPVIVYRAVGKYQHEDLGGWVAEQDPGSTLTVMVGLPYRVEHCTLPSLSCTHGLRGPQTACAACANFSCRIASLMAN